MLCFAQEGAVPHPGAHYTSFAVLNGSRGKGGRIQLAFVHVDVVPHCHIELGWFSTHEGIETGLLHTDSASAVCASALASATGKYSQHCVRDFQHFAGERMFFRWWCMVC